MRPTSDLFGELKDLGILRQDEKTMNLNGKIDITINAEHFQDILPYLINRYSVEVVE